jgi:hypothetical protein
MDYAHLSRSNLAPATAVTLLHRSIFDQIEAVILASPDCSRAASQQVDRYLLCSEAFGGDW